MREALSGCQRRAELHETKRALQSAAQGLFRIGGKIALKNRRLGLAGEGLAADRLAFLGNARNAGEILALLADRRFARGANGGKRRDVDLGAREFGAHCGVLHDELQYGLQAVVTRVMNEIGLGGGEQDVVDAMSE